MSFRVGGGGRHDLATEVGAGDTVSAAAGEVAVRLLELTGGRGVDAAVSAIGNPMVLRAAVDSVVVWGVFCCGGGVVVRGVGGCLFWVLRGGVSFVRGLLFVWG